MPASRRRFLTGATAALAAAGGGFGPAGPAHAAGEIGVSVRAQGAGQLFRQGGLATLRAGYALFEADRIATGADGLAELRLNTDTTINLGPESEITIDRYLAEMGGVIQIGGAIVFDRPDDLPPIDLTVRTAFAQIGVRGTRFFCGPSKGLFSVFVDRGSVSVRALGTTRIVTAGEGVEVAAKGAAPRPVVKWGQARIDAAFASVGL